MSGENYVNTASTATTAAPVGPSDLTFTVASYTGWPAAPFWGELEKGTASAEIVRVTNVAGAVLTIARGQGGTAATSHGAGVSFEHPVPADFFNRTEQHMAATNAHGVTGVVVGTQGAQTVQDKTFRGAHKSNFTDALPVGVTASYESVADNASARDGFVHKNTAGDVDRRGFLLQQSGTDRVQVFNDGTVDLTPSASTRPGLRSRGTTQLDGAVTAGGAVTVSGAANLNGGVSTTTVTASGTVSAPTVTASGNVTATGTIHANGNIDTDANLIVDGTSTLTGTVTAGTVTASGDVTAANLAAVGQVTAYGGKRAIIEVDATTDVVSPITDQLVWVAAERMMYRYNGSAWVRTAPFVPRAELRQSTLQSIGSSTFTALLFQTEDYDSHNGHAANAAEYVIPTGWSGKYKLRGGMAFDAAVGGGRQVRWTRNGSPIARGSCAVANDSSVNLVVPARSITTDCSAGDIIRLEAWHNAGGSINTNVISENQSYMSVEWTVT